MNASLSDHFFAKFGRGSVECKAAQRAFAESMAAYSLVCYFLQIKVAPLHAAAVSRGRRSFYTASAEPNKTASRLSDFTSACQPNLSALLPTAIKEPLFLTAALLCGCFLERYVLSEMTAVQDRHNGNILMDVAGHIIHIDFGFMLSNSPGGVNFEAAPFKLTRELLEIMDSNSEGHASEIFDYFKVCPLYDGAHALTTHLYCPACLSIKQ